MKHTVNFKMRAALWVMLGMVSLVSTSAMANCQPYWTAAYKCAQGCGPCGSSRGGGNSAPSRDYEAERRAQEAAAAAERERQAEAARIERERLAEEKRKNDEFIRNRDAAANTLKGSTGTNTPRLKGLSNADNFGLKGSGTDPGAQLRSVERHSREALSSPVAEKTFKTPGKADRKMAGQGFDTPGRASGNLVYPDKKQQQKPPTALDNKVPKAARNDPRVKEMLEWYRKLDGQKAEAEKKIAELKQQQATSKDPILAVKIETLNNNVKQYTRDQAVAEKATKKRVEVDLGLSWDEKPANGGTGAKK